jgi:transposase
MVQKNQRLSRKSLPEVRAQFARMIDAGVDADSIKVALNLGRSTFMKWKSLYLRGGLPALEVRPAPGGPMKLTDQQNLQVWSWVVGKNPDQLGFDFQLWTRKIVRDLIFRQFGVEFTLQGVGKLLARMGLTPQRPLRRAYEQDPDAVEHWKTVEYPKIRAEARESGASIFFADEASVRSDHHSGTTWAPVGRTPTVIRSGARFTVNMISAVAAKGEIHFDLFEGRMNSTAFIQFLEKLLNDIPGKIFLVVDGAGYHRSAAVKEFVESTGGRLRLFQLPAYSPQLNPDEWVWNNVKNTQVGRKVVTRNSDLAENAGHALQRLKDIPRIVQGFFHDPNLAYIR